MHYQNWEPLKKREIFHCQNQGCSVNFKIFRYKLIIYILAIIYLINVNLYLRVQMMLKKWELLLTIKNVEVLLLDMQVNGNPLLRELVVGLILKMIIKLYIPGLWSRFGKKNYVL